MSTYFNWKTQEYVRDAKVRKTRGGGSGRSNSNSNSGGNNSNSQEIISENQVPPTEGPLVSNGKVVENQLFDTPNDEQNGILVAINDQGSEFRLEYEDDTPNEFAKDVQFVICQDKSQNPNDYDYDSVITPIVPPVNAKIYPFNNQPDSSCQGFNVLPEDPEKPASGSWTLEYIVRSKPSADPQWVKHVQYNCYYSRPTTIEQQPEHTQENEDTIPPETSTIDTGCPCPTETTQEQLQTATDRLATTSILPEVQFTGITNEDGKDIRTFKLCGIPGPYGSPRNTETGFSGTERINALPVIFQSNPNPTPTVEFTPDIVSPLDKNQCWTVEVFSEPGQNVGLIQFPMSVTDPYRGGGTITGTVGFICPPTLDPPNTVIQDEDLYVDAAALQNTTTPADLPYGFNVGRFDEDTLPPFVWQTTVNFVQGQPLIQGVPFTFKPASVVKGGVLSTKVVRWGKSDTGKPANCQLVLSSQTTNNVTLANVWLVYDGAVFPTNDQATPQFTDITVACTWYNTDVIEDANIFKRIRVTYRINYNYPNGAKDIITKVNPKITDDTVETTYFTQVVSEEIQRVYFVKTLLGDPILPATDGVNGGFIERSPFGAKVTIRNGRGANDARTRVSIPYWRGNYNPNGSTQAKGIGFITETALDTVPGGPTVKGRAVKCFGPLGNVNLLWDDAVGDFGGLHRLRFTGTQTQFDAICNPGLNFLECEFDLPKDDTFAGLTLDGCWSAKILEKYKSVNFDCATIYSHATPSGDTPNFKTDIVQNNGENDNKFTWHFLQGNNVWFQKCPLANVVEDTLHMLHKGDIQVGKDEASLVYIGRGISGITSIPWNETKMIEGTHYTKDQFFAYFCVRRNPGNQGAFGGVRALIQKI